MAPHILIVEDEDCLLEVLRYNFEKAGYVVESLSNGDRADARLKEAIPTWCCWIGTTRAVGHRALPTPAPCAGHQDLARHHAHRA